MKVLVYGAGGHGRVVADILLASGCRELGGFLDDSKALHGSTVMGLPVLGGEDWLQDKEDKSDVVLALGIGDNCIRRDKAEKHKSSGVETVRAIHPSSMLSRWVHIEQGTVVMAGAVINPGAQIGLGVIINSGAVIEHDVVIGDYGHVSPNAVMGGESRLGPLSHLGLGAVVLPGVTIGRGSIIGAGAVVVEDVPDNVIAMGVPARIHRKI
jgi:sugar O-acyltransferase (sialic acid O-acetyltransferase NeuD family)